VLLTSSAPGDGRIRCFAGVPQRSSNPRGGVETVPATIKRGLEFLRRKGAVSCVIVFTAMTGKENPRVNADDRAVGRRQFPRYLRVAP